MIYHNNFLNKYKTVFGALKKNQEVTVTIAVDKPYKSCILRLWTPSNHEILYTMEYTEKAYEVTMRLNEIGLNWYCFILQDFDYKLSFYGSKDGYTGGEGEIYTNFPHEQSFQITCYEEDFTIPKWFKGRIMYQIFPDRFYRNKEHKFDTKKYELIHEDWNEPLGCTKWGANNFEYYGGNLQGIIDKLQYLQDLKIGVIYINPIFKSKSNHRYDVSTFLEVDEMLGYEKDFIHLCEECHKRDIKVIIDVSWNHVGDDSIYFNKYKTFGEDGAFNNKYSKYSEWFHIYPNKTYDCWWGFNTLPVINKSVLSYRNHVEQCIHHWNNLGIDGFRLDVIDELPDDFLEWFRDKLKSINSDLVVFGEVWDDASLKKDCTHFRSFLYGKNQDTIMNYVLRNFIVEFIGEAYPEKEVYHQNKLSSYDFSQKYLNLINNYPEETVDCSMNFLSTHDINRILSVFSECPYVEKFTKEEQGKYILSNEELDLGIKRFKLAWSLLLCLRGNPSLFYGDESGLYGYNDPYNRKPMNWDNLNYELINWIKETNKIRDFYDFSKSSSINFELTNENILVFTQKNVDTEILYMLNKHKVESFQFKLNDIDYILNPLSVNIYIKGKDDMNFTKFL